MPLDGATFLFDKATTLRVVIDCETSSTADLRKTGAHAYAEHPETRVTVLCYAIGDGPVRSWTGGPPPLELLNALADPTSIVVAHNYLFEFNIWHFKMVPLGFPPIPLHRWSCTMARGLVAGYPAGLESASRAAKLAIPKNASARSLMLRMARPRTLDPLTWWHETSPSHFAELVSYCATDVEAERLYDRLLPELSQRERVIFEVDHRINQRGMTVDPDLVDRLLGIATRAQIRAKHVVHTQTNGRIKTPNQVREIRAWLTDIWDLDVPDLRRPTVRGLLQDQSIMGPPRKVLQARLDTSRSSVAKLDAIRSAVSQDATVKGTFQYYGAQRTGRWAGRRLQPQNLFRGSIKDIMRAIRLIKSDVTDIDDLEALFEDSAMGIVASLLRSCIVARPGHKLVVCDLSQIEARVLAWLAGEQYALDCFARGDDIYTETARAIGSNSRQLGKVLVLACGFGMGGSKFCETAKTYGLDLSLDEAFAAVGAWRHLNRRIEDYWWNTYRALVDVTRSPPGREIRVRNVVFIRRRDAALIRLPSNRHLVYRAPHISTNGAGYEEFGYWGSFGGNWVEQRAWPGKTVENITQAVARDVLADCEIKLDMRGVNLVAQVHDELIAEEPEADADDCYRLMQGVMSSTPAWAPTLPMAAAGRVMSRYQKM